MCWMYTCKLDWIRFDRRKYRWFIPLLWYSARILSAATVLLHALCKPHPDYELCVYMAICPYHLADCHVPRYIYTFCLFTPSLFQLEWPRGGCALQDWAIFWWRKGLSPTVSRLVVVNYHLLRVNFWNDMYWCLSESDGCVCSKLDLNLTQWHKRENVTHPHEIVRLSLVITLLLHALL